MSNQSDLPLDPSTEPEPQSLALNNGGVTAEGSIPDDDPATSDPRQQALTTVVRELEQHVAAQGWDASLQLFSLVRTAEAIAQSPELAAQLPPEVVAAATADPEHLTAILQEDLPEADAVEDLLAQVQWPPSVDGLAISLERLVLPPEATDSLPQDPQEAVTAAAHHPKRRDMRLVAAALRDGHTAAAIRLREYDEDALVTVAPDLLPDVSAALLENLRS